MSHDLTQQASEIGKVTGGAIATAGTAYVTLTLADLIQYATLGAALATMFYYGAAAIIMILKYRKGKSKPL